jgi:DHA2 family multidrug resistance protein
MSAVFRAPNLVLSTLGLALAIFMQVLDSTIANVSLPTIAGNLGASAQQGTWVITAFSVSNAIALPLTGWLSRRFGEVRLFIVATILFTVMSFLCGMAQSMGMLIVFRAIQGFVAGPMYPVTQSLMIAIFPTNKRAMALALLSMVAVVAPIAGPILGGWITDSYTWPWIFFINVPIGIFACYVVWSQLRHKPETPQRTKMDYVGLITLVLGVGALQILLDTGNDEDWFSSNMIIALAIISAISITVFLIWELTEEHPIVNLRIFRHRNFTVGTIAYTFAYSAFFGGGLLVPLWLQTQLGYTSFWSGLATAPLGIFPIMLAPLIGKYSYRFDLRMLASVALLIFGGIFYLRSTFNLDIDFSHVAYLQLFQGIGIALFFMPLLTILLSDLAGNEIADGSGLATFMRTLGGSFAVSITTYMWNHRAVVHHAHLAETFTPYSPGTQGLISTIGHGNVRLAMTQLDVMINQQAFQISFNEIFRGLSFVLMSMIVLIWMAKPPFFRTASSAPVGEH